MDVRSGPGCQLAGCTDDGSDCVGNDGCERLGRRSGAQSGTVLTAWPMPLAPLPKIHDEAWQLASACARQSACSSWQRQQGGRRHTAVWSRSGQRELSSRPHDAASAARLGRRNRQRRLDWLPACQFGERERGARSGMDSCGRAGERARTLESLRPALSPTHFFLTLTFDGCGCACLSAVCVLLSWLGCLAPRLSRQATWGGIEKCRYRRRTACMPLRRPSQPESRPCHAMPCHATPCHAIKMCAACLWDASMRSGA